MPTEAEIEAAAKAVCAGGTLRHCNARKDESTCDLCLTPARAALEAAERVRATDRERKR